MNDMDSRVFRDVLGRFAAGVTVITARAPDGVDHGMTATAFSSLSLEPPLVLVCVSKRSRAHDFIAESGSFAVNMLAAQQGALSDRFAHRIKTADGYAPWPDDRDKFDDLQLSRTVAGDAVLQGVLGYLACSLHKAVDGGDHTIYIGRVEQLEVCAPEAEPLVFFRGRYRALGVA